MIPTFVSCCAAPLMPASRPAISSSLSSMPFQLPSALATSASCSAAAAPSTPSSAAVMSCRRSWISRRGWIIESRCGFYLDPSGQETMQPDAAWLVLDSAVAAAGARRLELDISSWRLVPVVCIAPADQYPRQWRVQQ